MTTTAPARTARRRLALSTYATEAIARFGPDPLDWRYRCPSCGHTQSASECAPETTNDERARVALACMKCGFVAENAVGAERLGLWRVKLGTGTSGGEMTDSFPLADELDDDAPTRAPHAAPGVYPAIPDPESGPEPAEPSEGDPVPSAAFLADESESEG